MDTNNIVGSPPSDDIVIVHKSLLSSFYFSSEILLRVIGSKNIIPKKIYELQNQLYQITLVILQKLSNYYNLKKL